MNRQRVTGTAAFVDANVQRAGDPFIRTGALSGAACQEPWRPLAGPGMALPRSADQM